MWSGSTSSMDELFTRFRRRFSLFSKKGRRHEVSMSVDMIDMNCLQQDQSFMLQLPHHRASSPASSTASNSGCNESLISLMTTTSTSGIAHSRSPISPRGPRNCRTSSNCSSASSQVSADSFSNLSHRQLYFGRCNNGSRVNLKQFNNPSRPASQASSCVYRIAEHTGPPLDIKPLFIDDMPQFDPFCPLVGRDWLYNELYEILVKPHKDCSERGNIRAALICGAVGTGKTAVLQQLALNSCLQLPGNNATASNEETAIVDVHCSTSLAAKSTDSGIERGCESRLSCVSRRQAAAPRRQQNCSPPASVRCRSVADAVVAYHFSQSDHCRTCQLPEFVANIGAMLACAPQLGAYREFLASNVDVQGLLRLEQCIEDPLQSFRKGIVEPLKTLRKCGKMSASRNFLVIVDGFDEAEFHRPESGDSIASFLIRHFCELPTWIKLVFTMKTSTVDMVRGAFPCHKVNLDEMQSDERILNDAREYVVRRINESPTIQANVVPCGASQNTNRPSSSQDGVVNGPGITSCPLTRFAGHLTQISRGNFLFLKLTLNLIDRNCLVIRSASFKSLPSSLSEAFLLMMNLRFPSTRAFERVAPVLNCVLAALNPLSAAELLSLLTVDDNGGQFVSRKEFEDKMQSVGDVLVQKSDGTFVIFHAAFREWLTKRHDSDSTKFLCDVKTGHILLANFLCNSQTSLEPEQLFELAHHMLKGHVYRSILRECKQLSDHRRPALRPGNIQAAMACRRNLLCPNTKISRLLLLAGADPNLRLSSSGCGLCPILCLAAAKGHQDLVNLLLEFHADPCAAAENGLTPLMCAASAGHLDLVQLFHQHGAQVAQWDQTDRCALVHAAEAGHVNIVSFLLQCDWSETASPHASRTRTGSNSDSNTSTRQLAAQRAFVLAAAVGHTDVCRFLLEFAEVVLDDPDPYSDQTALSMACLGGHKQTVQFFMEAGAQYSYGSFSSNKGKTLPLLEAVANGSWELVSSFLSKGVDVELERGPSGETALMVAAQHGHIGVMELLLSRDASVLAADNSGLTALMYACKHNQVSCASLLLERGANIDAADSMGKTCLHHAAPKSGQSMVRLLLDRGASLDLVDQNGHRPLELAILSNNLEALQFCLKKGAKLGAPTWLAAEGHTDVLRLLLNKLLEDGNVLYKRDRIKEAAQRYQYALKRIPSQLTSVQEAKLVDVHLNLLLSFARCKKKSGENDSAIELASKAAQLRPNSSEALYVRARCYRACGKLSEAMDDIAEAVRLCPTNVDARQIMARIRQELIRSMKQQPTVMDPSQATDVGSPTLIVRRMGTGQTLTIQGPVHPQDAPPSPLFVSPPGVSSPLPKTRTPSIECAPLRTPATPLLSPQSPYYNRMTMIRGTTSVLPFGNNNNSSVNNNEEDCRSSTDSGHVLDFEERPCAIVH